MQPADFATVVVSLGQQGFGVEQDGRRWMLPDGVEHIELNAQQGRPAEGYVVFHCPHCGGFVDTRKAMRTETAAKGTIRRYGPPSTEWPGLRYLGSPCTGCDKTFTVELTLPPTD